MPGAARRASSPSAGFAMEIVYCVSCGVRVSDSEMQSGSALRDAQGTYCARCAAARRPARQRTPAATREVPPSTRANRVIPPSARAPAPKASQAPPAVSAKSSNAVWILVG
ncbi:MAG: hypothetical protein NTW87_01325, partial [Planctomycetota bacterium]|nr:hypothetical protein [Planctomycetota bacterium]